MCVCECECVCVCVRACVCVCARGCVCGGGGSIGLYDNKAWLDQEAFTHSHALNVVSKSGSVAPLSGLLSLLRDVGYMAYLV